MKPGGRDRGAGRSDRLRLQVAVDPLPVPQLHRVRMARPEHAAEMAEDLLPELLGFLIRPASCRATERLAWPTRVSG